VRALKNNTLSRRERSLLLHDPMDNVHWTLWQALAWVAYRDADRVRDLAESLRQLGLENSAQEIWCEIGLKFGTSKAWGALLRGLEDGTVHATGLDASDGVRREIKPLEWLDLEFLEIDEPTKAGPQPYRKGSSNDDIAADKIKPAFRELRVRAADVLGAFPARAGAIKDPLISAPSLEAVLRESLRDNPNLTQEEALKIARDSGVVESREKIRKALKSLGGSTKPGPRGPRKNRAAPAA